MSLKPQKQRSQKDWIGLQVRLREELRQQLYTAAANKGVSMNAELIGLLERALKLGGALDDPGMVRLWQELRDIIQSMESLTGAKWQDDRATFVALKALLNARLQDLAPPLVNQAAIFAIMDKQALFNYKLEALLEILVESGAIVKLADRGEVFANERLIYYSTSEAKEIGVALRDLSYEPLVKLDNDPNSWILVQDDEQSSDQFAYGIKALLLQLTKLKPQGELLREEYIKASQTNDETERAGMMLAAEFRRVQTGNNSDSDRGVH